MKGILFSIFNENSFKNTGVRLMGSNKIYKTPSQPNRYLPS